MRYRASPLVLVLGVGACNPSATDLVADPTPCEASAATWDNTGAPLLTRWCTSCHSAHLEVGDRRGAPAGIDLDTLASAREVGRAIVRVASGDDATMPPAGGMSADDQRRLTEWVQCGLPGEPRPSTQQLSCEEPVTWNGHAVGTDLCVTHNAVSGDLTVQTDVDLSCLCSVGGDLRVEDSGVSQLRMPELDQVGGGLYLAGNAALQAVDLSDLHDIGGEVVIQDNPLLSELLLWRLHTVGGGLHLEANHGLVDLASTSAIEAVGGPLTLADNAGLMSLAGGFARVESVAGPIVVRDHPALEQLDGFLFAASLAGPISVRDNPQLVRMDAFASLVTLDAGMELIGLPRLSMGPNLYWLGSVGGLQFEGTAHASLPRLDALTTIDGDLIIRGCAELSELAALSTLSEVHGDLRILGNPQLPAAEAEALLETVVVGGAVELDG